MVNGTVNYDTKAKAEVPRSVRTIQVLRRGDPGQREGFRSSLLQMLFETSVLIDFAEVCNSIKKIIQNIPVKMQNL